MKPDTDNVQNASTVRTQFVETGGRKLAYRSVGKGAPIILCNRFWGYLDTWDPVFIDALARNFTVITFDYSGLGLSTGNATFEHLSLANDANDLAKALGYKKVIIGGWSLGGMAAQAFTIQYPELVSHAILIGTAPPGKNAFPAENLFFDTALKPHNDLADENAEDLFTDRYNLRNKLKATTTPILVISGDHDLVFPVENWHSLTKELPSMQLIVFPQAGHGPHHQFPETVAEHITTFIHNTKIN